MLINTEISLTQFKPLILHGMYGVNLYFEEKEQETQRLQFMATVKYCGEYENKYIYQVAKEELVINGNRSEEYLYEMVKKSQEAFYPFTILVDKTGTICDIMASDLAARWSIKREELVRYYKGKVAERYLINMDKMVKEEERIRRLVTQDLLFSSLFSLIYQETGVKYCFEKEIPLIPFFPPLHFNSIQQQGDNVPEEPDEDSFYIVHQGKTSKEYDADLFRYKGRKVKQNEEKGLLSATYQLLYELDRTTLSLQSLMSDFFIYLNGEEWKTVHMTVYRLHTNPLDVGVEETFTKNKIIETYKI